MTSAQIVVGEEAANDSDLELSENGLPFSHITHYYKRRLLEKFVEYGNVLNAAKAAGCSRRSHDWWLQKDEVYAEAFLLARECYADRLEHKVHSRVFDDEHPSDLLLMFATKAKRPEYRDNYGTTVNVNNNTMNVSIPSQMLAQIVAAHAERKAQRQLAQSNDAPSGDAPTVQA